jgi:polysaccharide deacetylase family protein (PEP-CTERM system associated)
MTTNLLTFDIEGFVEASYDSMDVGNEHACENLEREEIEANTSEILCVLAEHDQRATFFILGRIALDMPDLVRQIASAGHEIACHGLVHRRLWLFTREEVSTALREAKFRLEDVAGRPVHGFRAPDFSITRNNLWTLDLLKELSFVYDSSIFPTALHDVYGISGFARSPLLLPNGLVEVPMSTIAVLGQNLPFGGGGYLRLYPLWVTKVLIRWMNRKQRPCVVYLHPYEMGKVVRRIEGLGVLRQIRTYAGLETAKAKLGELLESFEFTTMMSYVEEVLAAAGGSRSLAPFCTRDLGGLS